MCRITELIELDKNNFFENKNIFKVMGNRGFNDKGFFKKIIYNLISLLKCQIYYN